MSDPAPRVFNIRGRWLLHDPPELLALGPGGRPRGKIATIPKDLHVHGVLDGRWLILLRSDYEQPTLLYALDAAGRQKAPLRLKGPWEKSAFTEVSLPATGARFLVSTSTGQETHSRYIVSLPDRRVVPVSKSAESGTDFFWREWLVLADWGRAQVFDVRSGRKLADLKHNPDRQP